VGFPGLLDAAGSSGSFSLRSIRLDYDANPPCRNDASLSKMTELLDVSSHD